MLDICEIEERELGRIVNYRVKVSRDETLRERSAISSSCTHFRDFWSDWENRVHPPSWSETEKLFQFHGSSFRLTLARVVEKKKANVPDCGQLRDWLRADDIPTLEIDRMHEKGREAIEERMFGNVRCDRSASVDMQHIFE